MRVGLWLRDRLKAELQVNGLGLGLRLGFRSSVRSRFGLRLHLMTSYKCNRSQPARYWRQVWPEG